MSSLQLLVPPFPAEDLLLLGVDSSEDSERYLDFVELPFLRVLCLRGLGSMCTEPVLESAAGSVPLNTSTLFSGTSPAPKTGNNPAPVYGRLWGRSRYTPLPSSLGPLSQYVNI